MRWATITEFDNRYEISDDGIIRNIKTKKEVRTYVLSGYPYFVYRGKGKRLMRKVHRLVATYHLSNPNNYPIVNHIDGNKLNFNLSNLEWCSHSQNELHSYNVLKKKPNKFWGGKFNEDNKSSKGVLQISLSGVNIKIFPSLSQAQREGFSAAHISLVCNGKQYKHKGFLWKFSN